MVRNFSSYFRLTGFLFVSLMLLSFGLAGCGESSECADVSCDFGVCEAGACVNPGSCETSYDCVPGYTCGEERICKALSSCASAADCPSGVCKGGLCVNPDSCEANDDCLERTFCDEESNTCKPDPCNTYQCEVGQCARGTRTCESKDTCTVETEAQDCFDDDKCFEGSCVDETTLCDELDCERGVCDFASLSCVNDQSCTGDSQCLDDFYCNDAGECADDLCLVNNVDCTGNGVCVAALGECENADPCASNDDCVSGHWCVEGTCRLEEAACGDAGCPGTQSCVHDDSNMTATCEESGNCQTALGCKDDRQCAGGVCLAPMNCQDDRFESNDTLEDATEFFRYASALAVDATVCRGDTDYFTIDTREIPNAPLRGTLIITAEYGARDAGLGELELELISPQGNSVVTNTSGPMGRDGIVEVRTSVNAATQGVYTVRIGGVDQLNQAGVSYKLSADLQTSDVADACDAATTLAPDSPIEASTGEGSTYALGSTCAGPHNPAQENIYQFELTETARVSIAATPLAANPELDLALSIRRTCDRLATEMSCANSSDAGGEVVAELLSPGTYYVIVETASGASIGDYRLNLNVVAKMCSAADSSCLDANTSEACIDGEEFVTQTCGLGCNYRTGECATAEGDTCASPLPLGGTDVTETIQWSNFTNQIEMPISSCVPGNFGDTQTRGPEAIYAVTLEPGFGLSANLEFPTGEHGSIYVIDGCFNPAASCLAGANDGSSSVETVNYVNETSQDALVYLVADSAGGGQSSAELSVQIGEVICQPGAEMCDTNGDVVTCNGAGTAWQVTMDCRGYGCTAGQCNPQCTAGELLGCSTVQSATLEYCDSNDRIAQFTCPGGGCTNDSCDNPQGDVCLDAIPAVDGTTYSGNFSSFNADYSPSGSACPGMSFGQSGSDMAFRVELQDGETVSASVSGSADFGIFAVTDCNDLENSCLAGQDSGGSSESITYTNSTGSVQTVFVIPGLYSASSGAFTVDFTISN
jgi:hypothetical protein